MPKRNHSEAAGSPSDSPGPAPKRARAEGSTEALHLLIDNADELISCLRTLQSEKVKHECQLNTLNFDDLEPSTQQNLAALSQRLLPVLQQLNPASRHPDTQSPQIPANTLITKWTASTLSKTLPPLPPVMDPVLEVAALTHSGMTGKPSDPSYERLEWIGDAYLEIIASSLVYQTFSKTDPGRCSQYRESLVRNTTLCKFARQYNLHKRANFPQEFDLGGRGGGTSASDRQRQKVQADIFEAYVGAVILSDPVGGVQRAVDWLKALWGPVLEKEIRREENAPRTGEQLLFKQELDSLICTPEVKIEYRDLPNTKIDQITKLPQFTVGVFLLEAGEEMKKIGFGTALGKKEAGQRAAKMALENRKLLQPYIDRKRIALEARRATLAAAEAAEAATAAEAAKEET